jgi:flagellar basal-body rod modification protein FlgD
MSITNTTSSTSTQSVAGAAASAAKSVLGKDDFLKLLMTQMQNQDPLSPTDNTAFVSQLAQFSSVEQMTSMNDTMSQLLIAQAGANQTNTASLVGKSVTVSDSNVTLGGTTPVALGGTLAGTAAVVTVKITNSAGTVVRTLTESGGAAGNWKGAWDGKDDNGVALPAGTYSIALSGTDVSGNAITCAPTSTGVVTGVSFVNGAARLVVNGNSVPLSSVTEIDAAPGTASK